MKKQKALPAMLPSVFCKALTFSSLSVLSPTASQFRIFFFSSCPSKAQITVSSCHLVCSQGQLGCGCRYWTVTACYCNMIHHQRELGRKSMNPAALPSWLHVLQTLHLCAGWKNFKMKGRTPNFHLFLCPLSRNRSGNCSSVQGWNHSFSIMIYRICTQPRVGMCLMVSSYTSAYDKFCSWDGHLAEGTQKTWRWLQAWNEAPSLRC